MDLGWLKTEIAGIFNYLTGGCREDGAKLFSNVDCDWIGVSWHKLQHQRFLLDMRITFSFFFFVLFFFVSFCFVTMRDIKKLLGCLLWRHSRLKQTVLSKLMQLQAWSCLERGCSWDLQRSLPSQTDAVVLAPGSHFLLWWFYESSILLWNCST